MSGAAVHIYMERPGFTGIPEAPLPPGFRIRPYRPGDGSAWVEMMREAEPPFEAEGGTFDNAFPADDATRSRRVFMVEAPDGTVAGSVGAWYPEEGPGSERGVIHWLVVRPAFQRRGLGRAALAFALRRMAEWHSRCMLITQPYRAGVIRLYLDFGFVPFLLDDAGREAWRSLAVETGHPALRKFRG